MYINGWDSSRGVEVFGRRRDRHAVESDERDSVIIPIYKKRRETYRIVEIIGG